MCEPNGFYSVGEFLRFGLTEKALFQVILGLLGISIRSFLLVHADWEKGGVCLRVCMCVCFMTYNYWDMFFVVRSNDSFNFPLGWIKYIVIVEPSLIRLGLSRGCQDSQMRTYLSQGTSASLVGTGTLWPWNQGPHHPACTMTFSAWSTTTVWSNWSKNRLWRRTRWIYF